MHKSTRTIENDCKITTTITTAASGCTEYNPVNPRTPLIGHGELIHCNIMVIWKY